MVAMYGKLETKSQQGGIMMHFHYSEATPMYYPISNTTTVEENPECIKHFGVLL